MTSLEMKVVKLVHSEVRHALRLLGDDDTRLTLDQTDRAAIAIKLADGWLAAMLDTTTV